MSTESSIIDQIKSLPNATAYNRLTSKMQTLKFFISDTKRKSPSFTAQIQDKNIIHTHLTDYFADSPHIFFYQNPKAPENYLKSRLFQSQVQSIFKEFIQTNPQYAPKTSQNQPTKLKAQNEPETTIQGNQSPTKNVSQQAQKQSRPEQKVPQKPQLTYPPIDFVKFLQFWLEKQSSVHAFYAKYYEVIKTSVQNFQNNLYGDVSKHVSQIPSEKKIKPEEKKQQLKNSQENDEIKEPGQSKLIEKKSEVKNEAKQKMALQNQNKASNKQETTSETEMRNSVKPIKNPQNQRQAIKQTIQPLDQMQQSEQNLESSQKQSNYEQNFDPLAQYIPINKLRSHQSTHSQATPLRPISIENSHYFLRKFYDHYCKKYINTIKNQQFQKLGDFYNSMNLTKFMVYVKDVKLLKLEKSLTAKSLQQHFKAQENQKHCLQFEGFAKIVMLSLETAFKSKDDVETKGYEHIGILNRQNFAAVMGGLGVIVPSKKKVFTKLQDARSLSRMVKSIQKDQLTNLRHSKVIKQNKIVGEQLSQGHGYESNWDSNKLHPDLFLNQKQRKQQRLLQGLTIPKLNKLRPSKHMDQKLHQMVDEDYDPYLKRYNQRNNKSAHENGHGHGMMKRIDERIHNVVKKIR